MMSGLVYAKYRKMAEPAATRTAGGIDPERPVRRVRGRATKFIKRYGLIRKRFAHGKLAMS